MPLPGRIFFSLSELAARWGCLTSDIASWSAIGEIEILASLPPVTCGGEILVGLLAIPLADILGAFRRDMTGAGSARVYRVRRPGEADWRHVSQPSAGVHVHFGDLMISRIEAERFEEQHEVFGRKPTTVHVPIKDGYDWDGATVWLMKRVHEQGVPSTQTEIVDEMTDWFARRSADKVPDERTIRRRVQPYWRALQGLDEGGVEAS